MFQVIAKFEVMLTSHFPSFAHSDFLLSIEYVETFDEPGESFYDDTDSSLDTNQALDSDIDAEVDSDCSRTNGRGRCYVGLPAPGLLARIWANSKLESLLMVPKLSTISIYLHTTKPI
ncbi:hypothetical protein BDV12DRAFT_161377 [Aspergillus spectabilis]